MYHQKRAHSKNETLCWTKSLSISIKTALINKSTIALNTTKSERNKKKMFCHWKIPFPYMNNKRTAAWTTYIYVYVWFELCWTETEHLRLEHVTIENQHCCMYGVEEALLRRVVYSNRAHFGGQSPVLLSPELRMWSTELLL